MQIIRPQNARKFTGELDCDREVTRKNK